MKTIAVSDAGPAVPFPPAKPQSASPAFGGAGCAPGRGRSLLPVAFAAVLFAAAVAHALLLFRLWPPCRDLDLRINEILCVLSGTDPYDVFEGIVESDVWRPFDQPDDPDRPRGRVNGYAPWEYTYLFPVALLPKPIAFRVWIGASFAAVIALWLLAVLAARRKRPDASAEAALWAGAIALCTTKAAPTCILCGNFGVFLPLLVFGMAWSLDRGRDLLAGLFLALLMVKPQMGALFFLPPLLRGRWRTIAAAAAILAAATVPPALLCGKPPAALLLGLAEHGDALARATGFVPPGLFALAMPILGASGVLVASALLGVALVLLALRILRRETDWLALLSVPALFATLWTYSLGHDRCLDALPLTVAALELARARSWRERRLPLAFVATVAAAGFLLWQSIPPFYPMHRLRPSAILSALGVPFASSVPDIPASWLLTLSIPLLVAKVALAFVLWSRIPSSTAEHPPAAR